MAQHEDVSTKIDLRYKEENVYCLFSSCSTDKKWTLYTLNGDNIKILIERLKHLEKLTWGQLANPSQRGLGLTVEKQNSNTFEMIEQQDRHTVGVEAQHYFHIRVKQRDPMRLLGYQYRQFFCITHIDSGGNLYHK